MKINKFALFVIFSFLLSFSAVLASYTYKITVLAPTDGEVLTRGTKTDIDWTVQSDNSVFDIYFLDIYLDRADGSCISGLPCPIKLGSERSIDAPFIWQVGYDSNSRTIPDGQYKVRVYSETASGPVYSGGPGTGKPVQGVSGIVTIKSPAPTPVYATPAPVSNAYTTPTTTTTTNTTTTVQPSQDIFGPTTMYSTPAPITTTLITPETAPQIENSRMSILQNPLVLILGGSALVIILVLLAWLGLRKKSPPMYVPNISAVPPLSAPRYTPTVPPASYVPPATPPPSQPPSQPPAPPSA